MKYSGELVSSGFQPSETCNKRSIRIGVEIAYVAAFYGVYTLIRDSFVSSPSSALANALSEIRLEKWLGIYYEASIQRLALPHQALISVADAFYGTAHFIVPIAVLLWVYVQFRDDYRSIRNALAWTTGISLVVYAIFPVMPPRLLPKSFRFEDTIRSVGGLPQSVQFLMKEGGNTYAAMPSLHVAWSLWAAVAVTILSGHVIMRALAWAFPIFTIVAVLITGNHYFLDVIAGAVVAWIGFACAASPSSRIAGSDLHCASSVNGSLQSTIFTARQSRVGFAPKNNADVGG